MFRVSDIFFNNIKSFYCYSYLLKLSIMVLTQRQYKNMSKEELIQELTDINSSFVNNKNCLKSLKKLHQSMTKFILSCHNVKASTHIYSPGSFSWSRTLLVIPNIVEERQLNWTLFLQKFMKMFWRKVFVRHYH